MFSSASTANVPFRALLAMASIIAVCTANPVVTDPWRDPCYTGTGGNSPTGNVDLVEVMGSLKSNAGEIENAAKNLKQFLTVSYEVFPLNSCCCRCRRHCHCCSCDRRRSYFVVFIVVVAVAVVVVVLLLLLQLL